MVNITRCDVCNKDYKYDNTHLSSRKHKINIGENPTPNNLIHCDICNLDISTIMELSVCYLLRDKASTVHKTQLYYT